MSDQKEESFIAYTLPALFIIINTTVLVFLIIYVPYFILFSIGFLVLVFTVAYILKAIYTGKFQVKIKKQ
jgi:hypothetical protein